MLEIIALLLSLAALFSFINERYLHLEMTIGLMLQAFILATAITLVSYMGIDLTHAKVMMLLQHVDFSQVVLQGILCFLLFAGAKNVPINQLRAHRWDVITLALIGTLVSTFFIGSLIYWIFSLLGIQISYLYALIFGAIISPTDPIAALAILKSIGMPENLEVVIDGESQFNDGIGVVIFVTLIGIASGDSVPEFSKITLLFLQGVFGGIGLGLITAFIVHYLMINSKSDTTLVLISLSAVSTSYALAEILMVSGPIASVVLGLFIGNRTIPKIKQSISNNHIDVFWEMINQILNAVLFVLIGLIALKVGIPDAPIFVCMVIAIAIVLLGRFVSVYLSMMILRLEHKYSFTSRLKLSALFTWAGLRGALAIALVLSLPNSRFKDMLITLVYGVVVWSILIQGATIKRLFSQKVLNQLVKKDIK
jgi:Na+:H+ antiporter